MKLRDSNPSTKLNEIFDFDKCLLSLQLSFLCIDLKLKKGIILRCNVKCMKQVDFCLRHKQKNQTYSEINRIGRNFELQQKSHLQKFCFSGYHTQMKNGTHNAKKTFFWKIFQTSGVATTTKTTFTASCLLRAKLGTLQQMNREQYLNFL